MAKSTRPEEPSDEELAMRAIGYSSSHPRPTDEIGTERENLSGISSAHQINELEKEIIKLKKLLLKQMLTNVALRNLLERPRPF